MFLSNSIVIAGIYLHIPFCKQACHYCDFHFSTSLKKKEVLIQALLTELRLRKKELEGQSIDTIYFGGGTPSLLKVEEIEQIIKAINDNYAVTKHPEITIEVNPDDLYTDKVTQADSYFKQLKETGINRLSIGIQSFFEEDLKFMNRAHNAVEAKACLTHASRYFDNITIDLIYGIPNMSVKRWSENLQIAFDFKINHISSYALTVEPKTALAKFIEKGTCPELDENLAREHFDILVAESESQGFIHYETSNFGLPQYFSKHNANYWLGESYLGIGPSAHSFNGIQRSWNISNNATYIKSIEEYTIPRQIETLSDKDRFNEYVMTGLRTIWGIDFNKVAANYGVQFEEHLIASAQKFIDEGLLKIDQSYIDNDSGSHHKILKTTTKGKFLADGLASELFMI